jgi:hypothetical protein
MAKNNHCYSISISRSIGDQVESRRQCCSTAKPSRTTTYGVDLEMELLDDAQRESREHRSSRRIWATWLQIACKQHKTKNPAIFAIAEFLHITWGG